jgi:hypothetical protein
MKARSGFLALLLAASVSVNAAEPPRAYRVDARVAHIRGALAALGETAPAELQQGIELARALERGACSAGAYRLRVECLLVAMKRYCHDRGGAEAQRCPRIMDVIASNVLADERLIPPEKRYQIIRENQDYRPALARELSRIQGTLAVDFRLQTGDAEDLDTMAANIDRYCLTSADETKLSYQACASSLVWFIVRADRGAR